MDIRHFKTKDIGNLGERIAAEYLRRNCYEIVGSNIRSAFGEIDIVAILKGCLYIVEVKTRICSEFPSANSYDIYDPGDNLHRHKINKVARIGSWYAGMTGWEGEWQVDGILVWLRESDGMARVRHYPQLI